MNDKIYVSYEDFLAVGAGYYALTLSEDASGKNGASFDFIKKDKQYD